MTSIYLQIITVWYHLFLLFYGCFRYSAARSSALETTHTVVVWACLYNLTVIDFSKPQGLAKIPVTLRMSPVFNGVTASIVQVRLFFSELVIVLK